MEQSCLQSFIEAAEELKIQGLSDAAEDRVKYTCQPSTVPSLAETSTSVAKLSPPNPTDPGQISQSVRAAPCLKDEILEDTLQQSLLDEVEEQGKKVSKTVRDRKDFKKFITKLKHGGKNGKTQHQCNFCGRTRPSKGHILEHVEAKHFKGVFTYNCSQCGKTFGFKRGLYHHAKRSCKFSSMGGKARLSDSAKMSYNHQPEEDTK